MKELGVCLHKSLVHEIDATWHPAYVSVLLMYRKLKDLGFLHCDGKIIIVTRRDEESL